MDKERKRGYYIHFQGRTSIGVSKKIDMQMEELRKYYNVQEVEVETISRSLPKRVVGLFPLASVKRDYPSALQRINKPEFLYVRRTVADRSYLHFWKEIKKRYPHCKIIIEIFTYPYDKDDFGKWNAWPFYLKELLYRRNLKKYVDRFVTYTEDAKIFGIPTIRTINGVCVDKLRKVTGSYQSTCLTMIGVAYMQRQHGYERVIEGMKRYYQDGERKYKIYLKLVGDGPEKEKYQSLVRKYNLQEYASFYPTTSGEELDELYDMSDLALAAFGMYKVGYEGDISALKTRECLAKGIPMLTESPIDVCPKDFPYLCIFPNDSSPVDMEKVICFMEDIRIREPEKEKVADELRTFAKGHVDMEVAMKPIVEYIECV